MMRTFCRHAALACRRNKWLSRRLSVPCRCHVLFIFLHKKTMPVNSDCSINTLTLTLSPMEPIDQARTKLAEAIEQGDAETVAKVLLQYPDMADERDKAGRTLLMQAARAGWSQLVEPLLQAGLCADGIDTVGRSSLSLATEAGHTDFVRALLEGHSNGIRSVEFINQADDLGVTALMLAAYRGHTDIVAALLAHEKIEINNASSRGFTDSCWQRNTALRPS
jgi:ankyrin repeat protein